MRIIDSDNHSSPSNLRRENSWAKEVESETRDDNTELARQDRRRWTDGKLNNGCWTDGLQAQVNHRKSCDKETRDIEKNRNKNGFGNDSTDEDSEDTNEEEYTKVDRASANKKRKMRAIEKKRKREEETARKARNIIGLGPFKENEIREKNKNGIIYENAKMDAVHAHLRKYYKFNSDEIENISIIETSVSRDTIYIAVEEREDITDLYIRKADCKRDEIFLRTYCPPQFFRRFSTLNRICMDERKRYPDLKTQIRFRTSDLEVLTKAKGSQEPFRKVDLNDFIGDEDLPAFDHSIKRKKHKERPARRRVTSSTNPTPLGSPTKNPAGRKESNRRPVSDNEDDSTETTAETNKNDRSDTEDSTKNKNTRQMSLTSQEDPLESKRRKTQEQEELPVLSDSELNKSAELMEDLNMTL